MAAFLDFGSLKAGTPLATASMPVRAVVPDENARATRKTRAAPVKEFSATISQLALSACRVSPITNISIIAQPTMAKIEKMKK